MTTTAQQRSVTQDETFLEGLPEVENSDSLEVASLGPLHRTTRFSSWSLSASKRCLDLLFSLSVLVLSFLPGVLIYLLVRLTSSGPGFFKQTRVGFEGHLFTIYKFRTMHVLTNGQNHPCLTREGDHRITVIGTLLRKLKLDELPQFYNVLRGDMSVVGPRPKLRQYVSHTDLLYRPGITGPATLFFRDEERLLAGIPADQLDRHYDAHIKPLKARIDLDYMERATLFSDLEMILGTVFPGLRPTISLEQQSNAITLEDRADTNSQAVVSSESSRADDFAIIDSM